MDFTFTEEQQMMAGAFRELLDDLCSPEALRAAAEKRGDESGARWARIAELGLPGVLAPEAAGGMGLGDTDFVLIAEEAGRAALPEPLVEQAGIAVPLLAGLAPHAPRAAEILAQAASGALRVAVGAPGNPFVLGAAQAGVLLLADGDEVHLVERAGVGLVAQPSIDTLRALARIEWQPSAATRLVSGAAGRTAWARAFERGALYAAAQCLGLTQRMIDIAVAYACERTQFGRPIGSYQAIKHHLATVQVKLEFARAHVYAAAARVVDADQRAAAAVSSAKLAAGDAAELAARTGIQVHGAMGYSWEVDLHFYMKRAWALIGSWGDRSFHMRRVQSLVLGGSLPLGSDQTFVRS